MKKLFCLLFVLVFCVSYSAAADGIIVTPSQEFRIVWDLGALATATQIEKRNSAGGEWSLFATIQVPGAEVADVLQDGSVVQYRGRSVREVNGQTLFSEYSDPSDWAIAANAPGCPGRIMIQP